MLSGVGIVRELIPNLLKCIIHDKLYQKYEKLTNVISAEVDNPLINTLSVEIMQQNNKSPCTNPVNYKSMT